ncbi:MAG: hypothetical protein P9M14_06100 [Candidatus Alcyoniella australis]|nr:hypothetical protein [Candidatus Alcyoniella australis]
MADRFAADDIRDLHAHVVMSNLARTPLILALLALLLCSNVVLAAGEQPIEPAEESLGETLLTTADLIGQQMQPPQTAPAEREASKKIPHSGFFSGLLHGLWSPVVTLLSLLSDKLPLIQFPNRGFLYNLGFLLGVAIVVLILRRLILWWPRARRDKPRPRVRPRRREDLVRWVDEDGMPVARDFEELSDELGEALREALEEQVVKHKLDDQAAEELLEAGHVALRQSLARRAEPTDKDGKL